MMKDVEIITIGDEVLMGQIVDMNASWLGERLTVEGVSVRWMTTVGDDRKQINEALNTAKSRAGAVIITGGLGPTPDDVTKSCLVEFFGDKLVLKEEMLEKVKKRFRDHGLELPETSRNQAEFPHKAKEIPNNYGTATGIHYSQDEVEWFSLPGVPQEMRNMVDEYVINRLREVGLCDRIAVKIIRTTGIGESFLLEKMKMLPDARKLVEIAFLPKLGIGVDVKLTARGDEASNNRSKLKKATEMLLPDMKPHVFGINLETLEEAVGRIAQEKSVRIAVAESCTGGLIAKIFTDVPGSSAYFDRGVVTYSNEAKIDLLGVPADLIEEEGAVSSPVAKAMARGMLKRSRADVAASVTGIAGPTGGTPEKPVGTVFIGIAAEDQCEVHRFVFGGNREMNRKRTAMTVMQLLHDRIKNLDSKE
ncbi:competence/damage-inducible protein A [candidate division LCP-89 bacterium B3_LCP]|uniref:CinA-like protein n=1 Tax=candidate division LCP-89 bacterium B3_LCP TaxID=2012998 RepID=A0A532URI6_UNCL8|nr:MAG: competence/damage-inducible protein A [candidate division LCP-89 bacterium B3_LCP]